MDLWRNLDWAGLLRALRREVKEDHVPTGAAALAFYMVLALFPAAIFGLSLLPYLPIPHLEEAIMDMVRQALPPSAADLFTGTVQSVLSHRSGGLLSFGFVFAIWSASSGLYAVMQQLNVVFDVRERRSFVRARLVALLLTLGFFALVVGALVLVIFGGRLQSFVGDRLGWSGALLLVFAALRWLVILAALQLAFALVYYFGPNVRRRFAFLAPGTTFATLGIAAVSFGFRLYVSNFGKYEAVYGGLGAVIVLLMWLFFVGWVILLGGEINQLVQRQKDIERGAAVEVFEGGGEAPAGG